MSNLTLAMAGIDRYPPWNKIDRALTLTQPWAGLVASGIKRIENRPWKPASHMLGQRFAIHASREVDHAVIDRLLDLEIEEHERWYTTSAIIGVARLVDYVSSERELGEWIERGTIGADQRRFWMGPFAFLLDDLVLLEKPVEHKGSLGFWGLSESLRERVIEQLPPDPRGAA